MKKKLVAIATSIATIATTTGAAFVPLAASAAFTTAPSLIQEIDTQAPFGAPVDRLAYSAGGYLVAWGVLQHNSQNTSALAGQWNPSDGSYFGSADLFANPEDMTWDDAFGGSYWFVDNGYAGWRGSSNNNAQQFAIQDTNQSGTPLPVIFGHRVAADVSAGELYVATGGNEQPGSAPPAVYLTKYDIATGNKLVNSKVPCAYFGADLYDIAMGTTHAYMLCSSGDVRIVELDKSTLNVVDAWTIDSFMSATDVGSLAIDDAGNAWVVNQTGNKVAAFDLSSPTGPVSPMFEISTFTGGPGAFSQPRDIAITSDGSKVAVLDGGTQKVLVFGAAPTPTPTPGPSDLTAGLISCWDMNESSGTRVDSAGSNDLSDVNGVTSAVGKIGQAAFFDNTTFSTEKALVGTGASALDMSQGLTVSYWKKSTGFPVSTDWGDILLGSSFGNTGGAFYVGDTGSLTNRYFAGAASDMTQYPPDPAVSAFGQQSNGDWQHIVAWYDPTDHTTHVTVDGVPEVTVYGNLTSHPAFTSDQIVVGKDWYGYSLGLIDEAAIWNRVLTSDERDLLYNDGDGLACPFPTTPPPPPLDQCVLDALEAMGVEPGTYPEMEEALGATCDDDPGTDDELTIVDEDVKNSYKLTCPESLVMAEGTEIGQNSIGSNDCSNQLFLGNGAIVNGNVLKTEDVWIAGTGVAITGNINHSVSLHVAPGAHLTVGGSINDLQLLEIGAGATVYVGQNLDVWVDIINEGTLEVNHNFDCNGLTAPPTNSGDITAGNDNCPFISVAIARNFEMGTWTYALLAAVLGFGFALILEERGSRKKK